jgi:hypothetical protein
VGYVARFLAFQICKLAFGFAPQRQLMRFVGWLYSQLLKEMKDEIMVSF